MRDRNFGWRSWLAVVAVGLLVACSGSGRDPRALVDEADAQLAEGGLEYPSVRADLKALYDEALRGLADADLDSDAERYVASHAHFGLAMTRLWDLADRLLAIFETGGVLTALRGEGDQEGKPSFCTLFEDFAALESIVDLLLRTALEPIIADLAAVATDPGFQFTIRRARYDLRALSTEQALAQYLDLAATYGPADVQLLLGLARLAAGTLQATFAYEGLLANLFLFSFVVNRPAGGTPAKLFNSNPCVDLAIEGNPLLDPGFGVLRADAAERLAAAHQLVGDGLRALANAFEAAPDGDPSQHLLGADASGWGIGLVETPSGDDRFVLEAANDTPLAGLVSLYRTLAAFLRAGTGSISPDEVAGFLSGLAGAVASGSRWRMRPALAAVLPDDDLVGLARILGVDTTGIPSFNEMETVVIDFGVLFARPPGDLKAVAPLIYLEDEPFEDRNGNGVRDPERVPVRSEEDYAEANFTDVNCNGRWDQRGDFVVAQEWEPFVDENGNGRRDDTETARIAGKAPQDLGLLGAFLDVDADGVPDRPGVDGLAALRAVGERLCGDAAPVTWPAAAADPDLGALPLRLADPTTDAPYGVPQTDPARSAVLPYEDGSVLGPVVGHYWLPQIWSFDGWPAEVRRDPANGVDDGEYYFFPDATLGGILYREGSGGVDAAGTTNAWLNRFLTQWGGLLERLGL